MSVIVELPASECCFKKFFKQDPIERRLSHETRWGVRESNELILGQKLRGTRIREPGYLIIEPNNMGEWVAQGHSEYCEGPVALVIKTAEESQGSWQILNKIWALPKRASSFVLGNWICRQVASPLPGWSLAMQNLRLHSRPTNSESGFKVFQVISTH